MVMFSARSRLRLAAAMLRALVSTLGISGERYTEPLTLPVSATCSTGYMRAIITGAASGNSAVLPAKLWPLVTIRRFVPSRSISSSRPACEEEDRPSTATIAATPIAIPNAESPARIRRVRNPTLATRARSEALNLSGARSAAPAWSRVRSAMALTAPSLGLPGCFVDESERRRSCVTGGCLDDVAALRNVGCERWCYSDPAGAGLDPDRVGVRDTATMVTGTASVDREASARAARGCRERDLCVRDRISLRVGDVDGQPDREGGSRDGGLRG